MFGRPLTFPSDACEFAPIARAAQATNAAATLLIAESSALSRSNGIPLGVELRHPYLGPAPLAAGARDFFRSPDLGAALTGNRTQTPRWARRVSTHRGDS